MGIEGLSHITFIVGDLELLSVAREVLHAGRSVAGGDGGKKPVDRSYRHVAFKVRYKR